MAVVAVGNRPGLRTVQPDMPGPRPVRPLAALALALLVAACGADDGSGADSDAGSPTLPETDGSFTPDTAVECDGLTFRLGDLGSLAPYDEIDPDLRLVLDDWLAFGEGEFMPPVGWELLLEEEDRAVFVHLTPDSVSYVTAESGANGWGWTGAGGNATCDVRVALPDGLSRVDWELAGSPAPDATTIDLLAKERACTGGREMGERLLPADVVETEDAVRIVLAAVPLTGDQSCPDNPRTPVAVSLDAPLGDRPVIDGLVVGPLNDLVER